MKSYISYYYYYLYLFYLCDCQLLSPLTSSSDPKNGYNEDAVLNFTQLTGKYGYHSERHLVVTEDGYILTVFRIPGGKKCDKAIKPSPVLIIHGLIVSSDTFIIAGPDVSLAYILADACYDVWCGNVRGNVYSRDHVTLDPEEDAQFWNYSYHEQGIYDVAATIDYMLNKTGADDVNYIGHSQGTSDFFVLTSIRSEYNKKIKLAILLAPVAWSYHVSSPFFQAVSQSFPALEPALQLLGIHEILTQNEETFKTLEILCQYLPKTVCGSILIAIFSEIPENISNKTISAVFGHEPSGTSTKNLAHYLQGLQDNFFRQFNYRQYYKNLEVYGQENPPEYNISKVEVPIVLVSGVADKISKHQDIENLLTRLPNIVEYYILPDDNWGHAHYLLSDKIPDLLARKVLKYLDQYNSSK